MTDINRVPNSLLIEYDGEEFDFYTEDAVKIGHFLYAHGNMGVSIANGTPSQTLIGVATSNAKDGKVTVRLFCRFIMNCVMTGGNIAAGAWVKPNANIDATYPYPEVVAITPATDPKTILVIEGNTANKVGKCAYFPHGFIVGA